MITKKTLSAKFLRFLKSRDLKVILGIMAAFLLLIFAGIEFKPTIPGFPVLTHRLAAWHEAIFNNE